MSDLAAPSPDLAKRLAKHLDAKGVIILAVDDDNVSGSSYGHTREKCRRMGWLLDAIIAEMGEGGTLPEV